MRALTQNDNIKFIRGQWSILSSVSQIVKRNAQLMHEWQSKEQQKESERQTYRNCYLFNKYQL